MFCFWMCFGDLLAYYRIPLVIFVTRRVCVMNYEHAALFSSSCVGHDRKLRAWVELELIKWFNGSLRIFFFFRENEMLLQAICMMILE